MREVRAEQLAVQPAVLLLYNQRKRRTLCRCCSSGVVPSEFDEDKGIIKWRVPRKLRVKSTSVFLSFVDPLDETNKNISWSFNLNLSAYYLPEYGENVKKERELMENIFSQ